MCTRESQRGFAPDAGTSHRPGIHASASGFACKVGTLPLPPPSLSHPATLSPRPYFPLSFFSRSISCGFLTNPRNRAAYLFLRSGGISRLELLQSGFLRILVYL